VKCAKVLFLPTKGLHDRDASFPQRCWPHLASFGCWEKDICFCFFTGAEKGLL